MLVFDSDGTHLGTLSTGERTANCGWGKDGATLFITADMYLGRVRLTTKGHGADPADDQRLMADEGSRSRPRRSAISHQPSVISHQSSVISHQSSVISHQSSVISHQSSVISHRHQSSVISHQSSAISH